MNQKPLYLLSYDHGGYILWGDKFAERLSSAAEWMRKYPKFKFGLDNEAYCYDAYAEECPEIMDKMKKMLKLYPNRFGIGSATYGQPLSAFIDHESNIRQLTYAIAVEQKYFGLRPPVYAMSEHAMHAQIPQLVAGCGYQMAMMRTHFQMYGFNPTYPVSFGSWVGMDGTKVPTVPTYDEEGAHFGRTTIDNWILTRWPKEAKETPEDFERMFAHIDPLLGSRYDDVVLRCEEMTAFAESKENYHWVILEDLPDIYKGLEDQMDFVTKPKDFTVRMPWGYCGNEIFRQTVKAQDRVLCAERVAAICKLLGDDTDCGELEKAWKNLLVAQHHDVQICGLRREAARFLGESLAASERVISRSMQRLADSMGGDERQNLLVFNPNARPVKQRVTCQIRGGDLTALTAVCGDERIPCRVDAKEYNDNGDRVHAATVSFVCELDGLSAKVFHFEQGEKQSVSYTYENGVLRCGNYQITLTSEGISEIRNQEGKLLLANGFITGAVNGAEQRSSGSWGVYPTANGVVAKQIGFIGCLPFALSLTVDTDSDEVAFSITTEHHGEEIGIPREYDSFWNNRNGFVHEEKLRFVFTPGVDKNKAYGVYTQPFVVDKTDAMYIEGNDFAAYTDGEDSVLMLHDGGKCLTRECEKLSVPLAFSHKYAWGVKALWGSYENDFTLASLCGADENAMLNRAEEYHKPLMTYVFEQTAVGITCMKKQFVKVDTSENVQLSALAPSKNGVLLRFWETAGKDGSVSIETALPHRMQNVDFLGNPIEQQALTPHKIVTYEMIFED